MGADPCLGMSWAPSIERELSIYDGVRMVSELCPNGVPTCPSYQFCAQILCCTCVCVRDCPSICSALQHCGIEFLPRCYLMLFVSVYDISFENFLRIPPPIVFCLSNALWVRRSPHQGRVARQQPESSRINSHTSSGLCHVNNSLETLAPAKTPRNC